MSGAYRGIIARALWIPARTRCDIRPALSSLWRVNCVWCRSRPARQRSCWSASPSRTCLTSDVLLTGPGRRPNFDVFDVLKLTERPQLHPKFDVLSPPAPCQTAAVRSGGVSEVDCKKYNILEIYPRATPKPILTSRDGLQGRQERAPAQVGACSGTPLY